MVLFLLGALAAQVGTGLFSNDDFNEGPLANLVSKATSEKLSGLHGTLFWVLLGLIVLHVVVVLLYAIVKRHDLVRPMVTGRKRLPATLTQPRFASPALAGLVLLLAAACVWLLVRFG